MKKLLVILGIVGATSAFADDAPVVVERLSCADISARVSEIAAIESPTEEETDELTKLKADYRRMCTKSARGRRTSVGRIVIEATASDEQTNDTSTQDAVDEQSVQTEVVSAEVEVVEVDPMIALEAELANLDAGLCADGGAPNKFGCCGDEIFKDLGDTVFACCPKDGVGDCFPPLK